jgi:putative transcriptional regulator
MPYDFDLLKLKQTEFEPAAGRILISVPYSNDAFFNRTVVLLTDYGPDSAAGLVLNRKLRYRVNQLADEIRSDAPLYIGGPVRPEHLFLLHNFDSCRSAFKVAPGLFVGYDNTLLALIEHNAIPAMQYRFLIGYAGWSPGQLDQELRDNRWVVGNPTPELVFKTEPDKIWSKAVTILGNDYWHWLQIPKDIHAN